MHLIQTEPEINAQIGVEKGTIKELRPITKQENMLDTNLGVLAPFLPFIILVIAAVLGGYIIRTYNLPSWTNWVVGGLLLLALLVIVF